MEKIYLKSSRYKEHSDDFLSIRIELSWDGMNTGTKEHLSTLIEKIEEDINMLSGNLEGENLYLFDTLRDRMSGMEMVFVS